MKVIVDNKDYSLQKDKRTLIPFVFTGELSGLSPCDNYEISATASQESAISATLSPKFVMPAMTLVSKLSFSCSQEDCPLVIWN